MSDVSKLPWQLTLLPHPSETARDGWPDYKVGGLTLIQAAGRLDLKVLDQTGNWLSQDSRFFGWLAEIAVLAKDEISVWDEDLPGGYVLKVLHRPSSLAHA